MYALQDDGCSGLMFGKNLINVDSAIQALAHLRIFRSVSLYCDVGFRFYEAQARKPVVRRKY